MLSSWLCLRFFSAATTSRQEKQDAVNSGGCGVSSGFAESSDAANIMPSLVNPGRIERLEIENFKSYKGHQVVGPFKNFTAIIGPNGAGKSNLMDAISFVLGVRSMQLRGAQLKDLLYAFDDKEREQRGRKAFVKLVFITGSGEELEFARTITSSGSSEYKINNKAVTWDSYNSTMKSLGILVKARNFLVFQVNKHL